MQADLKTFHQHGVYGASAITLLTVQNTRRVSRVEPLAPDLVREQVIAVVEDLAPSAAKTGALGSTAIVEVVASLAAELQFPLVVDPVLVSEHGARLLNEDAIEKVVTLLLPRATLVTPNVIEAGVLSGIEVRDRRSAKDAAKALADRGAWAVLLKGGHMSGAEAVDFLFVNGQLHELSAPRIDTPHTHGTGCTLSAAITARIALGEPLLEAVSEAKGWLTEALRHPARVGHGAGPVGHFTPITRPSAPPAALGTPSRPPPAPDRDPD